MIQVEPDGGKFFSIKKAICIPPRHYAVTQIKCASFTKAVTIEPDEMLKQEYPAMWIDTFYVDPNRARVDESKSSSDYTQVNNTDIEEAAPVVGACKHVNDTLTDVKTPDKLEISQILPDTKTGKFFQDHFLQDHSKR